MEEVDSPDTRDANQTPLQAQLDAYNRASERLAELLPPADYALVQQFFRQQQATLEMTVRLMNQQENKSKHA
jgi:hypothetical protein